MLDKTGSLLLVMPEKIARRQSLTYQSGALLAMDRRHRWLMKKNSNGIVDFLALATLRPGEAWQRLLERLAGPMLTEALAIIEYGILPSSIVSGYRQIRIFSLELTMECLEEYALKDKKTILLTTEDLLQSSGESLSPTSKRLQKSRNILTTGGENIKTGERNHKRWALKLTSREKVLKLTDALAMAIRERLLPILPTEKK